MDDGSDDTVRLRVPRLPAATRRSRSWLWPVVGAACLLTAGGAGSAWWLWPRESGLPPVQAATAPAPAATSRQASTPTEAPEPERNHVLQVARPEPAETAARATGHTTLALQTPAAPAAPAGYAPPLASEAEILADAPRQLAIYRFAPRPAVVVLQFPTLADQAAMLNRIAAFIEKNGYPHDLVLSRAALDAKIAAEGGTPDTFYYGHDYRSADVIRFLDVATDLNDSEQALRGLVQKLGWGASNAAGALVSLAAVSSLSDLDPAARATILRHELSHGVYFTDPAYAEYCQRFWRDTLSAAERQKFVAMLKRDGYDTSIEDLMINETQAYLMHTPDRRYFSAAEVGIPASRIVELRQVFLVGMPAGWLRDSTAVDGTP